MHAGLRYYRMQTGIYLHLMKRIVRERERSIDTYHIGIDTQRVTTYFRSLKIFDIFLGVTISL